MENKRRNRLYGTPLYDAPVDTSELADKVRAALPWIPLLARGSNLNNLNLCRLLISDTRLDSSDGLNMIGRS